MAFGVGYFDVGVFRGLYLVRDVEVNVYSYRDTGERVDDSGEQWTEQMIETKETGLLARRERTCRLSSSIASSRIVNASYRSYTAFVYIR